MACWTRMLFCCSRLTLEKESREGGKVGNGNDCFGIHKLDWDSWIGLDGHGIDIPVCFTSLCKWHVSLPQARFDRACVQHITTQQWPGLATPTLHVRMSGICCACTRPRNTATLYTSGMCPALLAASLTSLCCRLAKPNEMPVEHVKSMQSQLVMQASKSRVSDHRLPSLPCPEGSSA